MTITANLIMLSFSQTNHYKLSVSLDHLNTACFFNWKAATWTVTLIEKWKN